MNCIKQTIPFLCFPDGKGYNFLCIYLTMLLNFIFKSYVFRINAKNCFLHINEIHSFIFFWIRLKNVRERGEKLAHEVTLLGLGLTLPPLVLKAAHYALLHKLKESDIQGFAI